MGKGGRPTKLNIEVQEKIVMAVRAGNYIETAAAYAGVSKSTIYDWLRRGEREKQRVEKNPRARIKKQEEIYVEFSNALQKAMAEAEVREVSTIVKASAENWQAAAWRLERKYPDRWGRKKLDIDMKQEVQGQVEVKDDRLMQRLTNDDEGRELLKQLYRHSQSMEGAGEE